MYRWHIKWSAMVRLISSSLSGGSTSLILFGSILHIASFLRVWPLFRGLSCLTNVVRDCPTETEVLQRLKRERKTSVP